MGAIESAMTVGYPWQLARERVLADGRVVLVRPVHPDDLPYEADFLARLSPQARRNRFQRLTVQDDNDLARFYTRVDYDEHMAFVCTTREGGRDTIVGDARYFLHPDRRSCEFGIVVSDAWRHTGVAQHLMRALMDYAREHGVHTMASFVLRSNKDMLDFAAQLGFAVEHIPNDPERVRIVRTLQ